MRDQNSKQFLPAMPWFRTSVVMILSVLLAILIPGHFRAWGGDRGDLSVEAFTAHLDARAPAIMEHYGIPGASLALVKEGQVVWTKAYGYADLDSGSKMTADTYLRVQSISKPVTAWGIMMLAEQGRISIDESIGQYFSNWQFPDPKLEEVTARQLLSHTSGLALGDVFTIYTPDGKVPSLMDALSIEAIQVQAPGTFSYSNTGFNLLELLIQEVTGRGFAEYMQNEIMLPLGMRHSSFEWSDKYDVATGYGIKGNAVPPYVYPEKGSGGLFATAQDIALFAIAGMPQFNVEQALRDESIEMLHTPEASGLGVYSLVFDSYGLGHYIENLPEGVRAFSHGGQGTGIMTHLHFVPDTGDGIVLLTNSQRSWPFIAYILRDWANWCGFSSIGMSKIILGRNALWAAMGLLWFITILQAWRMIEDLINRKRRFAPLSREARFVRTVQSTLFIVLSGILLWCVNQKYLFLSSVFPAASEWLALSVLAFALVMLASALFPRDAENMNRQPL